MIWRDVLGSSEAVGSSTRSSFGFWISARQMPTRWRWPPDSSSARLSAMCEQTDAVEQAERLVHVRSADSGAGSCARTRHSRDGRTGRSPSRSAARPARIPGRSCPCGAARGAARRSPACVRSISSEPDLAAGRLDQPVDAADQRRLARARRPDQRQNLARRHLQIDGLQRLVAGLVGLGQLLRAAASTLP